MIVFAYPAKTQVRQWEGFAVKSQWIERNKAYSMVSVCLNIGLVGSLLMLGLYIITALLGGIGAVYGIAAFACMALMITVTKRFYNHIQTGSIIPIYEYLILFLCAGIDLAIWFGYPLNLILICVTLVTCTVSYITRERRLKQRR